MDISKCNNGGVVRVGFGDLIEGVSRSVNAIDLIVVNALDLNASKRVQNQNLEGVSITIFRNDYTVLFTTLGRYLIRVFFRERLF